VAEVKFETALKKLEEIVEKLESPDLSLDEALKLFESGVTYTRLCQEKLSQVEKKIKQLVKNNKGQLELEEMDS